MEIQKIFSDMYDEERLYSVLMSEEELVRFFSSKEVSCRDVIRQLYNDEKENRYFYQHGWAHDEAVKKARTFEEFDKLRRRYGKQEACLIAALTSPKNDDPEKQRWVEEL